MAGQREQNLLPVGYQKLGSVAAAAGITHANVAKAKYVLIKTEGQSVRWRDDGTNPTTTDGMLIDVGDEFWYTGDPQAIKFIETAATAVVHVALYR